MKQPDIVELIEAAYRVLDDDPSWLGGVLDAARPHLDAGFGVYGFYLDASDLAAVRVRSPILLGGPPGSVEAIMQINAALQLHPEQQRELGILGTPEVAEKLWARSHAVMTATQAAGVGWTENPAVQKWAHPFGIVDTLGIKIVDLSRRGMFLGAALPKATSPTRKQAVLWGHVAAHLSAGDRLRRQLLAEARAVKPTQSDGTNSDDAILRGAEAVLHPDGRIAHAEQAAKPASARIALREMAVAMDRARGALRRTDPHEAVSIWRGLAAGRWTLLDHFDRDGRRYLVARRNDAQIGTPAALSLRERQVIGLAALGHSVKLIAYELGLSGPTVSTHLATAMLKLGVQTRAELVQVWGAMAREQAAQRGARALAQVQE